MIILKSTIVNTIVLITSTHINWMAYNPSVLLAISSIDKPYPTGIIL